MGHNEEGYCSTLSRTVSLSIKSFPLRYGPWKWYLFWAKDTEASGKALAVIWECVPSLFSRNTIACFHCQNNNNRSPNYPVLLLAPSRSHFHTHNHTPYSHSQPHTLTTTHFHIHNSHSINNCMHTTFSYNTKA